MSLYNQKPPLPQLRVPIAERDDAVAFFRRCGWPITSVREVVGCGWARVKRVDHRLAGGRSVIPPELLPQKQRDVRRVDAELHVNDPDPEVVQVEQLNLHLVS